MDIRITIELEEYGEKFRVTSRPHHSVTEAFCEIGQVAEKQRRLIQSINYRRYK
jgi:hypothetical protein